MSLQVWDTQGNFPWEEEHPVEIADAGGEGTQKTPWEEWEEHFTRLTIPPEFTHCINQEIPGICTTL